jgi:hypothetical protein
VHEQLGRYPRNAIPYSKNFSVGILPHLQNGDVFPSLTSVRHPVGDVAHYKSTVGAASWSRTAARVGTRNLDWSKGGTGFRSLADAAGGIPRYGITRHGGNNDRLSSLWREVISLAGVARSFSSGGGYPTSLHRSNDDD